MRKRHQLYRRRASSVRGLPNRRQEPDEIMVAAQADLPRLRMVDGRSEIWLAFVDLAAQPRQQVAAGAGLAEPRGVRRRAAAKRRQDTRYGLQRVERRLALIDGNTGVDEINRQPQYSHEDKRRVFPMPWSRYFGMTAKPRRRCHRREIAKAAVASARRICELGFQVWPKVTS